MESYTFQVIRILMFNSSLLQIVKLMATCSSTSLIICSIDITSLQIRNTKKKLEKNIYIPPASADKTFKYLRTFVSSFPQGGEIQPENKNNNE